MPHVRQERPADFAAIRSLLERAFEPSREEAELVDALRAAGDHVAELCLAAALHDAIVGHIAFSRARLGSGHEVLALAPMAVAPEHQRSGVGAALIQEGMRRAAATDLALVVVVGHPEYYPRFGFEPAGPLGIVAPFDVAAEAFMAYRLPSYSPDARGTLSYAAAFGL
jgi:predicted N-acetyltransferase YhbS